jgi:general secretion pathway protein N
MMLRWFSFFVIALLFALAAQAPAAWLVAQAGDHLKGQVEIQNASGTIWRGSADVRHSASNLNIQSVRWRFQPAGLFALQWRYAVDASDAALAGSANAGFGFGSVTLSDSTLDMPARTASAVAPVLGTFSPDGRVLANIRSLQCKGDACSGDVALTWRDAAVALAELRPLGDYQIDAQLRDGNADFDVKTLKGTLRAAGKGQFQNGALRFTGELSAPPDQLPRVQGLMRLFGTPDERGVVRINR